MPVVEPDGPELPVVDTSSEVTASDVKLDDDDTREYVDADELFSMCYCSVASDILDVKLCGFSVIDRLNGHLDLRPSMKLQVDLMESYLAFSAPVEPTHMLVNDFDGTLCHDSWNRFTASVVYEGPFDGDACFYLCVRTGECFASSYVVDKDTGLLTDQEIYDNFDAVNEADRNEIRQFVDEHVWTLRANEACDTTPIDCTWVRRWKWKVVNGKRVRIVKSRLCARGFLDSQNWSLPTRATTATRLSQRLLISLSVIFGLTMESWDVTGAFLKGLPFSKMRKKLLARGIATPIRKVYIQPPANVWRHLRELGAIVIYSNEIEWYSLECLKAMYGLGDAPLAFQVVMQEFLDEIGGRCSAFDECFYFWLDRPGKVTALAIMYVDDEMIAAHDDWRRRNFEKVSKRFGGATRSELPMKHVGIEYSYTQWGLRTAQDEFCQKLQPVPLTKERASNDSSELSPAEKTAYRGILGGLLWVCQTHLEAICDTVLLQQHTTSPTIAHMKAANSVLAKIKKLSDGVGLLFGPLTPPFKLDTVCDPSGATLGSSYAQEAAMVLLCEDHTVSVVASDSPSYHKVLTNDVDFSRRCHVLAAVSHKSKRVSGSTSRAETLAGCLGKELAQLIAVRLTEVLGGGIQLPLDSPAPVSLLIQIQEDAAFVVPIDHYTDCRDFFQLAVGQKGVPQDRHQRLYVMSIREDRLRRAIRNFYWIPTSAMLCDALTKPMISEILYDLLTIGYWRTPLKNLAPLMAESTSLPYELDEQALRNLGSTRPDWAGPATPGFYH